MVEKPTSYAVQVTTSASKPLRSLSEEEWVPIRHCLAHIAFLAAARVAPDPAILEAAGFAPPILRVQVGEWLILYEVSPADWMVTVRYLLKVPAIQPRLGDMSRLLPDKRGRGPSASQRRSN